jgi:hypothetical protein
VIAIFLIPVTFAVVEKLIARGKPVAPVPAESSPSARPEGGAA